MRVFAYIARRYNSAAEATSLLSSVASLAIIVAGLKIRELYEENVVSSLQPVSIISQRKDIRYCRRENIELVNNFWYFLHLL